MLFLDYETTDGLVKMAKAISETLRHDKDVRMMRQLSEMSEWLLKSLLAMMPELSLESDSDSDSGLSSGLKGDRNGQEGGEDANFNVYGGRDNTTEAVENSDSSASQQ